MQDSTKAAFVLGASLGLFAGLWLGLWSIPTAALDVPTEASAYAGGALNRTYQPVPTWYPWITVLVPFTGAWFAYQLIGRDELEERDESNNYLHYFPTEDED